MRPPFSYFALVGVDFSTPAGRELLNQFLALGGGAEIASEPMPRTAEVIDFRAAREKRDVVQMPLRSTVH